MTTLELGPGALSGTVAVPPSKSLLHRAMICAALAGDPAACRVPEDPSQDVVATRRALAALFRDGKLEPQKGDGPFPGAVYLSEDGVGFRVVEFKK